ncbi:MAG TPA: cbb3-type cytochrome c oxidase subunit I [Gemmatimonadaceae bacterium]|nr:cbb3-type cytochrome c oxidase subunit I [Gemmatimonadaceae bacterium]
MHSLVRRYIKTAIGFLMAGLAIGAWMIVQREIRQQYPGPYEVSAHTHAIFVGFVMMMIMGVALWLFPRPERTDTRYRPALAGAAYWCVTVGTGARVVGELLRASVSGAWLRWAVVASGFLQIVGIALFFATMWSRIRAVGSQAREAAGERF